MKKVPLQFQKRCQVPRSEYKEQQCTENKKQNVDELSNSDLCFLSPTKLPASFFLLMSKQSFNMILFLGGIPSRHFFSES